MKKISLLIVVLVLLSGSTFACSDIFINQPVGHIEARTMDFGSNMGEKAVLGYIGQNNVSDIIVDVDKIPEQSIAKWTVAYGYWGRTAFNTPKVLDGMNTEGLTYSLLYLNGLTQYPAYDSADKRRVIGIYDLGSYLLGSCRNVSEAVSLLKKSQVVSQAVEAAKGIYVRDIPIHIIMRDATGRSAVVEFIGGKTVIYENAGNVLTNQPTYPEQLALAKNFDGLTVKSTDGKMDGLPGGYSSEERFAHAYILTRNLPQPLSHQEAIYQADNIIMSLTRPYLANNSGYNSCTIWTIIKDTDEKVIYLKTNLSYQGGKTILPGNIKNGYEIIDLKAFNWKEAPRGAVVTMPTPKEQIVKLLTPDQLFH